ncbi:hypothetical protein LX77_00729 [Gelidibacter algens]|uniref:Uncharacterized protein n=1 Tax=Gelidibacter algens TaxID=49280 RepID=A0A1A7R600_9FLAO|nr:hypothetical protein [Gelidibacter algens]OBX26928.1 hypothetical protein A9996_02365 [Gelidibacter algens]RAJ26480.1 hypothetical protein LX77_00729 [Gelidibacter algens]
MFLEEEKQLLKMLTVEVVNLIERKQLNSARESDELECDQFYIQKHDLVFKKYEECVTTYRFIKDKVYQKLLV